jgi:N-acetylglutamate synthase-like GNAT family acetyltransferase
MKSVQFRTFQSQDVNTIHALIIETITACYSSFPPAYRQHWIEDHYSTERIITDAAEGHTLVIEHQGEIIGIGNLLQDEVQSVFIHPDYQQRGLGTQLMIRLEEHATQQSITEIQVYALTPSRPFFEQLGYHTISEHQFKDPQLRQFKYYIMVKQIE